MLAFQNMHLHGAHSISDLTWPFDLYNLWLWFSSSKVKGYHNLLETASWNHLNRNYSSWKNSAIKLWGKGVVDLTRGRSKIQKPEKFNWKLEFPRFSRAKACSLIKLFWVTDTTEVFHGSFGLLNSEAAHKYYIADAIWL